MSVFSGFAWRVVDGDDGGLHTYYASKVTHNMYDSKVELYWNEPIIWAHDCLWNICPTIASHSTPLFEAAQVISDNRRYIAVAVVIAAAGAYLKGYV